jgi:hypothetical protein
MLKGNIIKNYTTVKDSFLKEKELWRNTACKTIAGKWWDINNRWDSR